MLSQSAETNGAANPAFVGRVVVKVFGWYVPRYTPEMPNQTMFSEQIISEANTKMKYIKRSVCEEDVTTDFVWKLVVEIGIRIPLYVKVGLHDEKQLGS